MATFLIVYGTGAGQTAKVARALDGAIADRGHDVTTRHVTNLADVDVGAFDAVLVGASVVNRRHQPEVVRFVEANLDALASRPSAFFQVSLASAMPWRSAREGAMDWVDALVDRTGWQPDDVGLFAGAIAYSRYGGLTRAVFRVAAALSTGDTDASRDYEYTDWEAVEAFGVGFAESVEAGRRERRVGAVLGGVARVTLGLVLLAGVARWLAARDRSGRDRRGDRAAERAEAPGSGIEAA